MEQDTLIIEKETTVALRPGSGKLAFVGDVALILLACGVGLGLFRFWHHPVSLVVQSGVFLLAGLAHVSYVRERMQFDSIAGEWIYTLVMTVLLAGLLRISVLWNLHMSLHLIVCFACAFLLPFAVSEMWRAKVQLAFDGARAWYPTKEKLVEYPSFYFNSSPMEFLILPGKGESKERVAYNVSKEMSLGKIFYDLVENKLRKNGREITLADAGRKPYHWIFFTRDSVLFSRTLDPEKTIGENGLKEKAMIFAQKIFEEDLVLLRDYKSENN